MSLLWKRAEKECLKFRCPMKNGRCGRRCGGKMFALPTGTPTYDMQCSRCNAKFQVKSKKGVKKEALTKDVSFPAGTRSYTAPAIRKGKFNLLLYERGYGFKRVTYISGEDMKKWARISRRGLSTGCMVTLPWKAPIFREVDLDQ